MPNILILSGFLIGEILELNYMKSYNRNRNFNMKKVFVKTNNVKRFVNYQTKRTQ